MFAPEPAKGRRLPCTRIPRSGWQLAIWPVCFLGLQMAAKGAAIVANGGFDDGIAGWEIRGAVVGSPGIAVLTDANATVSILFQPVAATAEKFAIAFDFRNALSPTVPMGRLADTFFATLYFTDTPQTFDISTGNYDRAVPLFDMDANGAFNVQGTLSASSKGPDWSRFTAIFDNVHADIVPAFELRDLNLIDNDSAVAIDDVVLFAIPEPMQGALTAMGAGLLIRRRRRNVASPRREKVRS